MEAVFRPRGLEQTVLSSVARVGLFGGPGASKRGCGLQASSWASFLASSRAVHMGAKAARFRAKVAAPIVECVVVLSSLWSGEAVAQATVVR